MKEIFTIGKISTTHGVRGQVKVLSFSDSVERFKELKEVYIEDEIFEIENVKTQPERAIIKFKGIDSIDDAIKYKNKLIKIDRKDAQELPEGRYYASDIVGCVLRCANGDEHGLVKEVIFTAGANDVYWSDDNGEDFLVPVIESVVLDINIDDKVITIRDLEHWL